MNLIDKETKEEKLREYESSLMKIRAIYHSRDNELKNNKKMSSQEIERRRNYLRNPSYLVVSVLLYFW